MQYKHLLLLLSVLFLAFPLSAQQTSPDDDPRLLLALSTADYPATPGDIYNLSYYAAIAGIGGTAVSMPLTLDAGYQLKVQNMGTVNARNKTYLQVKREVENLVTRNYPLAGPACTLLRMGRFTVLVTGETAVAGNRSVDGLTRVSALATGLTGKASIRFIQVTSAGGMARIYDLFVANRNGDLSQNPYVSPGDTVVIPTAGRIVDLRGEVYRADKYELLAGEQLPELIEQYGSGFTKEAARDKIVITRLNPRMDGSREVINLSSARGEVLLADGDIISVANKEINRQAVFFEGAVFAVAESGELQEAKSGELQEREEQPRAVTRIPYYFYPGETLGRAGRSVLAYFSDVSDLAAAYVLRGSKQTAVNLEQFLYQNDMTGDIPLESGDVIVVPYRQFYTITGEVAAAGNRTLNTLARLSSLLTDLTAKASSRLVTVVSGTGAAVTYDLFQAQRFGDLSQDPYIRPGDKIRVIPSGRVVTLSGEVFRPGTYELLPGEQLESLVEYYGDGLTLNADPGRIRLSRISTDTAGETRIFPYQGNSGMILEDRDVVTIGSKALTRPVVFFEGALARAVGTVEETTAAIEGMAKMEYPFYEGETLGNAVRANADRFTASSDLANAYVIRDGTRIPMDVGRYIYYNDFSQDLDLVNGDTIVIPFRQFFVLVSGAVKLPGMYPYIPDRQAEYYISLAGGRDELRSNGRGMTITDMNNRKLEQNALIEPETMINIPTNRFTAYFNQYGPIVTTILSIITTVITIFAITLQ